MPELPADLRNPDDAALEATRMSLGDHLEELRRRMFWVVGVLLLGFIPWFLAGDWLLGLLIEPIVAAVQPGGPGAARVTPARGREAGGETVTIVAPGTTPPLRTVLFASTPAAVLSTTTDAGAPAVVVTTPPGRGPVAVRVVDAREAAAIGAFAYGGPPPASGPTLDGLEPASGSVDGGTDVTLTGTGFGGGVAVLFGTTTAAIRSVAPTRCVVRAPRGSETVAVQVVVAGIATAPLAYAYVPGPPRPQVILSGPTELIVVYCEVALAATILSTSPITFPILWGFVAAGLYPRERRWVYLFAPATLSCFLAGAAFLYLLMLPPVMRFLLGFWAHDAFTPTVTLASYAAFFLWLAVIMGLVFQTPLVMIFLTLVGLVEPATYARHRRWVIVIAVVVAAILTPPDVVSQLMMAGPFLVLYELGLLCCRLVARRRKPA